MSSAAPVPATGSGGDTPPVQNVLANKRFLALFLSQILTQVGGNMVLFGLTVQVYRLTGSSTSVSILLLTFLVPAVIFGAIAGVYVDRFDRRLILVATNVARGVAFVALVFFNENLILLYVIMVLVSTLTTFFAPAEAAMIPIVVERSQLMSANGVFIFTLQASFVAGFALLGPLTNNLLGLELLILLVAGLYLLAGVMCWTLPPSDPVAARTRASEALDEAERAVAATFGQLLEGLAYIRNNRAIFWSITYLAITGSLVGVLGVLGPDFAVRTLGLEEDDFVIVVLPLGMGLVLGVLLLNVYGKYFRRQRLIEGGMITLGFALLALGLAQRVGGPIFRGPVISLLSVVIAIGFLAGVAYAFVAVPSQTQLQEELPEDVRGRVFGVLNMLLSVASLLPIVIVGPVADLVGTPAVIIGSAVVIAVTGVVSVLRARPTETRATNLGLTEPVDPLTVASSSPLTRPVRVHHGEGLERPPRTDPDDG